MVRATRRQKQSGSDGQMPLAAERLFVILKLKMLNFRVEFLKIVTVLCRRVIDTRLLFVYVYFYQKMFTFTECEYFITGIMRLHVPLNENFQKRR